MTFLHPLFEKGVSLFMENPAGQSVGFIAMFILFYAFSIKDDRKLVKVLLVSSLFWIIHFFFLNNFGALIATGLGMLRLVLSLKYKKHNGVFLGIVLLSLLLGYISYEGLISLIPITATLIASYGFFYLEKSQLRILLLGISNLWLYYHIQTGSISGVINEIVVQITLCITVYRFIYERERYSYDTQTGKIAWRNRILAQFTRKPKTRRRIDYGRFAIFRDRRRFETKD